MNREWNGDISSVNSIALFGSSDSFTPQPDFSHPCKVALFHTRYWDEECVDFSIFSTSDDSSEDDFGSDESGSGEGSGM